MPRYSQPSQAAQIDFSSLTESWDKTGGIRFFFSEDSEKKRYDLVHKGWRSYWQKQRSPGRRGVRVYGLGVEVEGQGGGLGLGVGVRG